MAGGPLRRDDVEVAFLVRYDASRSATGSTWPCPGCGHRASLDGAWVAKLRNLRGPSMVRRVLICRDCAGGFFGRSEGVEPVILLGDRQEAPTTTEERTPTPSR